LDGVGYRKTVTTNHVLTGEAGVIVVLFDGNNVCIPEVQFVNVIDRAATAASAVNYTVRLARPNDCCDFQHDIKGALLRNRTALPQEIG